MAACLLCHREGGHHSLWFLNQFSIRGKLQALSEGDSDNCPCVERSPPASNCILGATEYGGVIL